LQDFLYIYRIISNSKGEEYLTYSQLEVIATTEFRHVRNVTLYDYLDQARMEWYRYCHLLGVEAVLVHIQTDFRKEVFDQDKLVIQTNLERIGNTSFTLKQTIIDEKNELVVSAESILATIDLQTRRKIFVPKELRRLLPLNTTL
jgi:YbgC/YbaW family acyl-CoA thioester hydrolase